MISREDIAQRIIGARAGAAITVKDASGYTAARHGKAALASDPLAITEAADYYKAEPTMMLLW